MTKPLENSRNCRGYALGEEGAGSEVESPMKVHWRSTSVPAHVDGIASEITLTKAKGAVVPFG